MIDIREKELPTHTYETFQTSEAGVLELCNEHWLRLARLLSEFEMVLALHAIPGLRLPEAGRIALHYKNLLDKGERMK